MITVPEATKTIVERSRYLSEAISKNLINLSSLARYIKPELKEMLQKEVSESSIIMALKRLKTHFKPKHQYSNIFKASPEMILHSNLIARYVADSKQLDHKYNKFFDIINKETKHFLIATRNITETTIIASRDLQEEFDKILEGAEIIEELVPLSSITIRLPKEALTTPGVYYFLLKSLAWEGINIIEIISTAHELTLVFDDKDTTRAFAILKSLFPN